MTDEEIHAHIAAHDAELNAQSEKIRTLRAENEDLKTAKAKQESKINEMEAKHAHVEK